MLRTVLVAGLAALGLAIGLSASVEAGGAKKPAVTTVDTGGAHPASAYYRRGPQVRGFVARRGGYSYTAADSINTYGDSRSRYGGASVFRDPMLDRQTNSGPFDHGFFFDSGIGPRGGDSPYMN
jgi:hypothetical protein